MVLLKKNRNPFAHVLYLLFFIGKNLLLSWIWDFVMRWIYRSWLIAKYDRMYYPLVLFAVYIAFGKTFDTNFKFNDQHTRQHRTGDVCLLPTYILFIYPSLRNKTMISCKYGT